MKTTLISDHEIGGFGIRTKVKAAGVIASCLLLFSPRPAEALLGSLSNLLNNTILQPIVQPVADPLVSDVLAPVVNPLLGGLLADLAGVADPLLNQIELLNPIPANPELAVIDLGTNNALIGVALPVTGVNVVRIKVFEGGSQAGEDITYDVLDLATLNVNLENLLAGTTYTIQVLLTDVLGSVVDVIDEVITTLPLDPILSEADVVTTAANDITSNSAQLNGSIANAGIATIYFFEYGRTAAYGSQTTPFELELLSGGSPQPVSAVAAGLNPNTLYHFRLVAINPAGRTDGQDLTFTTLPAGAGPNVAPVAADDFVFTQGQGQIGIDVLSNDYDANGDTVSVLSFTQPALGFVEKTEDDGFVYTPGPGYAGSDFFTYTITDNRSPALTDEAVVNISDFGIATTGVYNGLAINTLPRNENQAFVRLKVNKRGGFSGQCRIAGTTKSFRGRFGPFGSSIQVITRAQRTPVTLQLRLNPFKNAVDGFVYAGGFGSALHADKAVFNKKMINSPYTGRYTLGFTPSAVMGAPQGSGYAMAQGNRRGLMRIAGRLADDTPFTSASFLSGFARWPVYANLFGRKAVALRGSFSGNLSIENFQTAPSQNLAVNGAAYWFKPLQPGARFNPGFSTVVGTVGSRYSIPTVAQLPIAVANPLGAVTMVLSDGNLAAPLSRHFILTRKALLPAIGSPEFSSIRINPRTGVFSGRFLNVLGGGKLGGVFHQRDNFGIGFFTGLTQTGTVLVLEETSE